MIRQFLFVFLLIHSTLAQPGKIPVVPKAPPIKWPTLSGTEPIVVARGGYAGMFPESSVMAYQFAKDTSLPDVVFFCNLQLTKDEIGVCQSSIRLENTTDILAKFPDGEKTYDVNGEEIHGWFALDYESATLITNLTLMQGIYTRPSIFDSMMPVTTPDDVKRVAPENPLWLNVEYDMFYNLHKLSAARYIQDSAKYWTADYISSPEIGFLKAMGRKADKKKTKLIFKFKKADMVEPTTKEKYSAILEKLSTIKSFASGILVPKDYIWPANPSNYLLPPTTLVADAHKEGLEVFASGFANDDFLSYNYSYDPVSEYLNYVGGPQFAVDGVLTEFPSTASEAIACFAHQNLTQRNLQALVISHNGASGDYPGSTDLAYQKAMDVGADIIDCAVQMSKDGVPFCMEKADLTKGTTAFRTFVDRSRTIPEIQSEKGVFSFDLTWSEIKSLKPVIEVPATQSGLLRNPLYKNKGNFLTLPEFLELAKTKETVGVMIDMRNAAYLASKQGFSVVDVVTSALNNSTFDKKTTRKVLILSEDTSVLARFKDVPNYKKVLYIARDISDAPKEMVEELKKHADGVLVTTESVVVQNAAFFTTAYTNVAEQIHAANLSLYVGRLRNEYITISFDYCADPYLVLSTLIGEKKVDGVVTDFPATAVAYMSNPCSKINRNPADPIMRPIAPGELLGVTYPEMLPPAEAPAPALGKVDIIDPPLPAVAAKSTVPSSNSSTTPTASPPAQHASNSPKTAANVAGVAILSFLLVSFFSIRY